MKSRIIVGVCGIALLLGTVAASAEDKASAASPGAGTAAKALPRLLIKGEVVSIDANDPTAILLKVKDRYGFETPIYVTSDAKVTQGDNPVALTNITAGTPVGVEYNFDVNTAKRHAVSVKVEPAAPAASAPAAAATPAAPAADTSAVSMPSPEATSAPTPAAPVAPSTPDSAATPAQAPATQ